MSNPITQNTTVRQFISDRQIPPDTYHRLVKYDYKFWRDSLVDFSSAKLSTEETLVAFMLPQESLLGMFPKIRDNPWSLGNPNQNRTIASPVWIRTCAGLAGLGIMQLITEKIPVEARVANSSAVLSTGFFIDQAHSELLGHPYASDLMIPLCVYLSRKHTFNTPDIIECVDHVRSLFVQTLIPPTLSAIPLTLLPPEYAHMILAAFGIHATVSCLFYTCKTDELCVTKSEELSICIPFGTHTLIVPRSNTLFEANLRAAIIHGLKIPFLEPSAEFYERALFIAQREGLSFGELIKYAIWYHGGADPYTASQNNAEYVELYLFYQKCCRNDLAVSKLPALLASRQIEYQWSDDIEGKDILFCVFGEERNEQGTIDAFSVLTKLKESAEADPRMEVVAECVYNRCRISAPPVKSKEPYTQQYPTLFFSDNNIEGGGRDSFSSPPPPPLPVLLMETFKRPRYVDACAWASVHAWPAEICCHAVETVDFFYDMLKRKK